VTGRSSNHRRRLLDARLRGHDGGGIAPPALPLRRGPRRRLSFASLRHEGSGAPKGAVTFRAWERGARLAIDAHASRRSTAAISVPGAVLPATGRRTLRPP
jgi:hypothetical protein